MQETSTAYEPKQDGMSIRELVENWPVEKWIQYDFENARRRKSIR